MMTGNMDNPRYSTQPANASRSMGCIFAAFIVGGMLPVVACSCLVFATLAGFGVFLGDLSGAEQETGPAVGVIDLYGPIVEGSGFGTNPAYIKEQLDWMDENKDVKALVIRADSPGGGVNASDEIWKAVEDFSKPVVVYMHGTCASGCLYVASAADESIASRNTVVGSIGVISTFFNVEELTDDVGVSVDVIITGENKDFGSPFREMTEEERAFWKGQLEIVLDHFVQVVANRSGSTLTEAQVRELATGQAWIAPDALQLGLIDSLGYEKDALDYAAQLAGMGDYRVQEYPFGFSELFRLFTSPSFSLKSAVDEVIQPVLEYRYYGP